MTTRYSARSRYAVGFLIICLILLSSVYLQVMDGIEPCPLCTLQRIAFGLLGILFFLGLLFNPKRVIATLLNIFLLVFSSLGIFLAGRQVWLQHFQTNGGGECGVGLDYMLKVLPLHEVAEKVFTGSAECSQRGFELLYLNTAEWALLWFVFFFGFSVYMMIKRRM